MEAIPNTNDMYYVSSHGRVYSKRRKIFLKSCNNQTYRMILVSINKQRKAYKIHRLVAEAFIPKVSSDRHYVNHIDGDKTNNHVSNLEWVTHEENMEHAFTKGLHSNPKRPILCVELNKVYESIMDASRELNLFPGDIGQVCKGNHKTCGGYTFRYLEEEK